LKHCVEFLGPSGSLFCPTYAYFFPKERFIDLRQAPSEVGAISEAMRTVNGVQCSGHALFRHHGLGSKAKEILQPNRAEFNAFDSDSAFARMLAAGCKICFLGAPFSVNTFTIYVEYLNQVAYRFLKPFAGRAVLQCGTQVEGDFQHYCMPMNGELQPDFSRALGLMKSRGCVRESQLGMGTVLVISMSEYVNHVSDALRKDPWFLLARPPRRLWGMVGGGEQVVRQL
jgi:aminoglycoside 3-N-acetyltransferase